VTYWRDRAIRTEARVQELEARWAEASSIAAGAEARVAALEAAARAVVDDLEAGRSVRCPVCDAHLRYQEHGRGCSIVALAALLDGAE
jgi:hypothetical protein